MKSVELNRQVQRLRWLFDSTPGATADQLELQAHWGRYLCVLVAGFLEIALRDVYGAYCYQAASPAVASYAVSQLSRVQNPKAARFISTARDFRPDWSEALSEFLAENGRKEAIDSIMANRHLIAHGRDSGITLARTREYLGKSIEVIEFIERQCGLL
jgi:hypothetical protein